MTAATSRLTARAVRLPVIRILARLGAGPVLQAIACVYLVACTISAIQGRPDLLHPTAIGTDASNYYAAGLRLDAGHPLYARSPGDRDVPLNPPYWTAPLLSPPPVAVAWRVLALLPGDVVMTAWALAGGVLMALASLWLVSRLRARASLAMIAVGLMVALTIWSGNVQTYLDVGLILAWLAHERGRPATAGAIAGIAAALKISPILLLPWFIARRDWRGTVGMVATLAVVGVISLAGAGLQNHLAYLDVVFSTSASGATPQSLPAILAGFGVPGSLARLAPLAAMAAGTVAMWPLRRRPGLAWGVALLAGVYSTPVVHIVGMSILLAALAPHRTQSLLATLRRPADNGATAGPADGSARAGQPLEPGAG